MMNRRVPADEDLEILGLRLAPDDRSFLMRYAVIVNDLHGRSRDIRMCRVAMYGDHLISSERIRDEQASE